MARCPTCRREFTWDPASPARPFCSERCKLIDLGAWATERHAIPAGRDADASNEDSLSDGAASDSDQE